jgi:hypothetical protein
VNDDDDRQGHPGRQNEQSRHRWRHPTAFTSPCSRLYLSPRAVHARLTFCCLLLLVLVVPGSKGLPPSRHLPRPAPRHDQADPYRAFIRMPRTLETTIIVRR